MAILTPLSLEQAQYLGKCFDLRVMAVDGILAGSVNSNYRLTLHNDSYAFLRIYEEQGKDGAARELRLLTHLHQHQVKTPCPMTPLTTVNELVEFSGKPVAVFPWINGEMICQNYVSLKHMEQLGAQMALIHQSSASFHEVLPSRFHIPSLQKRIADTLQLNPNDEIRKALELAAEFLSSWSFDLPVDGIIHGDLFRDNVLWSGKHIEALLDFESASTGYFAFDLAVTMLAWCFSEKLNTDLMRSFLHGYQSNRALKESERQALYPMACLAAVRFLITRITDFELRPRGSGIYKDYRRFWNRWMQLKAIGPSGFEKIFD